MRKFTINLKEYGNVLVGLSKLMDMLPFMEALLWGFKDMDLIYKNPFGLNLADFERLSRDFKFGFLVADSDFREFLRNPDFQVVDGLICGYDTLDFDAPKFVIECIDSSQWEITANSDFLIEKMERFQKSLRI